MDQYQTVVLNEGPKRVETSDTEILRGKKWHVTGLWLKVEQVVLFLVFPFLENKGISNLNERVVVSRPHMVLRFGVERIKLPP